MDYTAAILKAMTADRFDGRTNSTAYHDVVACVIFRPDVLHFSLFPVG
jgi:hypothetical protein